MQKRVFQYNRSRDVTSALLGLGPSLCPHPIFLLSSYEYKRGFRGSAFKDPLDAMCAEILSITSLEGSHLPRFNAVRWARLTWDIKTPIPPFKNDDIGQIIMKYVDDSDCDKSDILQVPSVLLISKVRPLCPDPLEVPLRTG